MKNVFPVFGFFLIFTFAISYLILPGLTIIPDAALAGIIKSSAALSSVI